MNVEFVNPAYLILLGIIPIIIFLHFFMLKAKRSQALKFANFEALARVSGVDLLSKNIFILAISSVIIVLLVFSLAGLNIQRTVYSSSFTYVIAIDSSSSMEATDFLPNRLEVAKQAAIEFVNSAPPGTKIGVISFSGNAFIEQGLTEDKNALTRAINNIPISAIGGTDIGEAVITSTNLLESEEAKSLILLSDGRINVGTIDTAIEYANKHDIIIHSIGIGTEAGGQTSFGLSKIDEDALNALAYNTNGRYFKAEDKETLSNSFKEIVELKLKKVTSDTTPYLTIAILVLFILEYILISTRFRVLP
ncbi:MAG: VWA domain-containing protein [Nanoarchaeota archaeon]|nr:VWA domain-containing protein [Nanoarchaeota archaeon]MBU0977120.1 VWA domain-containing protein [Nanoarchaeota archaeon]